MDLVRKRLTNHRLARADMRTPAEVVRWLGAVQAQDYPAAKWALGLRARSITDADVDRAFDAGEILRTHILRPTWHFVTPADIRWMLALSAPRIHAVNRYHYRRFELDPKTLNRGGVVLERALRGKNLTRAELQAALRRAGIPTDSMRLAGLVMHAELEGVVVSGPRRGKQFTYALLDERARSAGALDRDEALGKLTRRYFSSHGPATLRDYAWWSGLTVSDAKRGLEIVRGLSESTVDGLTYRALRASRSAARMTRPSGHLLPNFDEYLIAYKDRGAVVVSGGGRYGFSHSVLLDGRLAGSWARKYTSDSVVVEASLYGRPSRAESRAIASAAERYIRFVGVPGVLSGV